MKRITATLITALALTVAFSAVNAEEEVPWFDLENCEMCVGMTAKEGLMDAMGWEHHMIESGMVSITTVPAEFMEAFARAGESMMKVQEKLAKGGEVELCGFCKSTGSLMAAGVKQESITTNNGAIMLMTSTDAELVEKIKAHGQRTIDEHAKMLEMDKAGTDESGEAADNK